MATAAVGIVLALIVVWAGVVYSSAAAYVEQHAMPHWFSVPPLNAMPALVMVLVLVYGAPVLFIVLAMWALARIRAMSEARVADREEVRFALRGLSASAFQKIATAFPADGVNDANRGIAIDNLFKGMWGFWRWLPARTAKRSRLESLIRGIDREVLPSVKPGRLKDALKTYFTEGERKKIGDDMNLPVDVFEAAKLAHRLAELETRMRAEHPAAL